MNGVDPDTIVHCRAFHCDCFREQAHASLRRAIAGQPCRPAEACNRRHNNDGATAGTAHCWDCVFDRQEYAVEVDRGLPTAIVQRHLDHFRTVHLRSNRNWWIEWIWWMCFLVNT